MKTAPKNHIIISDQDTFEIRPPGKASMDLNSLSQSVGNIVSRSHLVALGVPTGEYVQREWLVPLTTTSPEWLVRPRSSEEYFEECKQAEPKDATPYDLATWWLRLRSGLWREKQVRPHKLSICRGSDRFAVLLEQHLKSMGEIAVCAAWRMAVDTYKTENRDMINLALRLVREYTGTITDVGFVEQTEAELMTEAPCTGYCPWYEMILDVDGARDALSNLLSCLPTSRVLASENFLGQRHERECVRLLAQRLARLESRIK